MPYSPTASSRSSRIAGVKPRTITPGSSTSMKSSTWSRSNMTSDPRFRARVSVTRPTDADSANSPDRGNTVSTTDCNCSAILYACSPAKIMGSTCPNAPAPNESARESTPTVVSGVIPNWDRNVRSSSRGAESDKNTTQSAHELARRVSWPPSTSMRRVRSSFSTVRVAVPGVSMRESCRRLTLGKYWRT